MATGTATLNFGAFPGATDASVAVTGQAAIVAGTHLAEPWVWPIATAEHSADEHRVEELEVYAADVITGTGFTIYGITRSKTRLYGNWSIAWAWGS